MDRSIAVQLPDQHRADMEVSRAPPISSLVHACTRRLPVEQDSNHLDCRPAPEVLPNPSQINQLLVEPLSNREMQLLVAVCNGDSNKEIADHLELSVPTVKWHLTHVFGKLGVARRVQAVAVAIHLGLVRPNWLVPIGSVRPVGGTKAT